MAGTREQSRALTAPQIAQAAEHQAAKGSVSPYLHAVMVLAYNLRLRGIEVTTLTDAHHTENASARTAARARAIT